MQRGLRCLAPLRVTFSGGGTDVEPFASERGGCALSATIDRYVRVSLAPGPPGLVIAASPALGLAVRFAPAAPVYDGRLDLVKAAVRRLGIAGVEVRLEQDAAPGSGLGSSSALAVALVAALRRWQGQAVPAAEIAALAYEVERQELGQAGGYQDQYAAAYGGLNYMEFGPRGATVRPLPLEPPGAAELQRRLVLCNTGRTRVSGVLVAAQTDAYRRGDREAARALGDIKAQTVALRDALLTCRWEAVGRLLHDGWEVKRRLNPGIYTRQIDRLYEVARRRGARGGHVQGAGGGGHVVFYFPGGAGPEARAALAAAGVSVVPFRFEPAGARLDGPR